MDTPQSRQQSPPGAVTAFARFALLGGGVGITSGFAVAALAAWIPWVLANALITVASTLLATELHARFTFGVGRPATRRQHAQSAGSAAAAYTMTCVAMLVLQQLVAAPGAMLQQAVYLSASALAGVARFAVLRLAVFTHNRPRNAVTARPAPAPRCSAPDRRRTAETAAAARYSAHGTRLRSAVSVRDVHGHGEVQPAHKTEVVPPRLLPVGLAARQGSVRADPASDGIVDGVVEGAQRFHGVQIPGRGRESGPDECRVQVQASAVGRSHRLPRSRAQVGGSLRYFLPGPRLGRYAPVLVPPLPSRLRAVQRRLRVAATAVGVENQLRHRHGGR
jgi:putative flippase GtrA